MILLGLIGFAVAYPGLKFRTIQFDVHTLLFSSLAIVCGYEAVVFALFTKTFAIAEGLMPEDGRLRKFFTVVTLERGLIGAAVMTLAGLIFLGWAVNSWRLAGFGHLDYGKTMRLVIPGATLTTIGLQTFFSAFFLGIMGMRRR